ncbi:hypothetical protein J2X63_001729 [Agromyces sp. 3263]|uniref:DUF6328 family protein n=1 Tax=Agromyces sp. 3263 TaxID=2817750 RepID=UPI0028604232|nr:DUF6328 family protein [Agromyces sp. 3263]MDR6906043.1 hypothetical protein [Agromyces sp. 3263]
MNARHAGPPVSDALGRVDDAPSPDGSPRRSPTPAHDEDVAPGDGRNETPNERSDRNWSDILQELRVALTGTQLIGGFLLAVAFQQRFEELDQYQLVLYLVLVALAGLATIVGLAPVTLHRTLFRHQVKERIVRTGNRLLIAHLAVVALLVLGVTTLIFDFAVSRAAGIITFVVGAIVLVLLWLVLPRLQEAKDGDDPEVVRSEAEAEAGDERKGVGAPS